ncbi:TetR family transcriptional regulator [Xenophilus sp. AP218F]|nr:TetR family transcriptional regulator [Xenophilus sp. AP218F]
MRYRPQHKAETRQRIVAMAGLRFRAEGVNSVGIANLMADLGLTHGGFYTHFANKEQLVAAACQQAMQEMELRWREYLAEERNGSALARLADDYLSPAHRDFPDSGCVAAALGGELARQSREVRRAFSCGLRQLLDTLGEAQAADSALPASASLALMVGALLLARAVDDDELSARLLREARQALDGKAAPAA